MFGTLIYNDKKELINQVSQFQPSQAVKDVTSQVRKDYQIGKTIMETSFRELNDMTLNERADIDQKAFNIYTEPKSDNPDDNWKWNKRRGITRNKIISMAAQLTATILFPKTFAQNEQDEEDRDSAEIMNNVIEWNIRNSDYEITFLYGIVAALTNPVAYMEVGFTEAMQEIREKQENGEITLKEAIDEVLSGFQLYNVPADEVFLTNAYEYYIQRQRAIIRRKFIDYDEAEALFGDHENFKYVHRGIRVFYNDDNQTFYEQADKDLDTLCEVAIYYNRRKDLEIPFVNGVYMSSANPADNPIKHRDQKNCPKYKYVKFGFEPIDEKRFFAYKSLAFKLTNEQALGDETDKILVDASKLEAFPPIAGIGTGKIDTSIMYPATVVSMKKDARLETLGVGRRLEFIERLIDRGDTWTDRGSQDPIMQGQTTKGDRTKYEVYRQEENSRINLGIAGKMIAQMVKDLGELMLDDIVQHQTVAEVNELLEGNTRMKYMTFLLPNKIEEGRTITKKIQFTDEFIGQAFTKKEKLAESYKRLEESGGLESKFKVYKVNAQAFRNLKFKVVVDVAELLPRNEYYEKALKLEAYKEMIQNPYCEPEAVTRDFLIEPIAKGNSDKYIRKQPQGGLPPMPIQQEKTPVEQANKEVLAGVE